MKIWVDADACPKIARELVCKTAIRTKTLATFVSNGHITLQKSPYLAMITVGQGFDVADDYIVAQCVAGDLVITSDIPLASELITKDAKVLNFRGIIYNKDNIKQRLNMRDFMETMRGTGMIDPSDMGGQKPYSDKEKKSFADGLNRLVSVQSK